MRSLWRVGAQPDEVWIVRAFDASLPRDAQLLRPENAAWAAGEWFGTDGSSLHVLAELVDAIGHPLAFRPDFASELVRDAVSEALRSGLLKAYRVPEKLSGSPVPKDPDKPKEPDKPTEKKTWIAIQLLDDQKPPQPVPYKRYR